MNLGSNASRLGLLWLSVAVGASFGCIVVGQESVIEPPVLVGAPTIAALTAQAPSAPTPTPQPPLAATSRPLAPSATPAPQFTATTVRTVTQATSTGSTITPSGARYTVEAGDTLSALSRRFGVPVAELARLSGLSADAELQVRQQVVLPPGLWSDRLNIRVVSPQPGSTLSSPVVIEGTASVFENIVNATLLDASGGTVARASERAASPDIGQHGAFRMILAVPESARGGPATIQVYWSSPRDGAPADLVPIPIMIAAN